MGVLSDESSRLAGHRLGRIETVFLDAGNTLISMDYDWIRREMTAAGLEVAVESVIRAEAAARPATSRFAAERSNQSGIEAFVYYLTRILEGIPAYTALATDSRAELISVLTGRLKKPGEDYRLWSRIMPGVPDALASLRESGLDLVVVSNSDGSVERALDELGLSRHLSAVLDSHVVGYEKPDPRFFTHALFKVRASPRRTLHVGDMYYQDVVGARAAGIDAVLLDPYDDWDVADCMRCPDLPTLAAMICAARR
jgi:HAD superfamily hydrolase (TIGR01662 family)